MRIRYRPSADGQTYNLTRAIVKNFQDNKYITLDRQSTIAQTQITIQRNDEQLIDNQLNTVFCPADGVEKVTTYLSCMQKVQYSFSSNCWKKDSALCQLWMYTVKRQMYKTHNRQNTVHQGWRTNIPNHFRR